MEKKLIVFLGSGVSLASGLPSVSEMRERLFGSTAPSDRHALFSQGRPTQDLARVKELLCLLEAYDESDRKEMGLTWTGHKYISSGAIFRGPTTYEDLYALCQAINLWSTGESDIAVTGSFVDMIERSAGSILVEEDRNARIVALGHLVADATEFIKRVVVDALTADNPVGFELIVEALRDPAIEEVNIVTLNHDTLVEQLLAREGIAFVDGFGEQDGDVRWYDDTRYDIADARVKLLKLHGSINWYTFIWQGRGWPAVLDRTSPAEATDCTGKSLKLESRLPSFLCGGNKDAWYQHGLFADIHFRFHQALRRCSRMVISGFGWGDVGITNQIDRWLDQSPDNRLILLHEHPEELASRSKLLAMSYDYLIGRRQLISVPRWLSDTSFNQIEKDLWV